MTWTRCWANLLPMTIVTHAHRPKRARKRKAQAAALNVPAIVRAGKKAPVAAATDDDDRKSAIVTAKKPRRGSRFGDVPDMTPEEHKRRGDAADALFREMKRQIAASKR